MAAVGLRAEGRDGLRLPFFSNPLPLLPPARVPFLSLPFLSPPTPLSTFASSSPCSFSFPPKLSPPLPPNLIPHFSSPIPTPYALLFPIPCPPSLSPPPGLSLPVPLPSAAHPCCPCSVSPVPVSPVPVSPAAAGFGVPDNKGQRARSRRPWRDPPTGPEPLCGSPHTQHCPTLPGLRLSPHHTGGGGQDGPPH